MKRKSGRTAPTRRVLGLLAAVHFAGAAMAQTDGVLSTTDNRDMPGQIKWNARGRAYEISAAGSSGVLAISLDKVAKVKVNKTPAALDGLVKMVQSGSPGAAIPGLEQIVQSYEMLIYDLVAAPPLADAYLATGKPADALRVCEQVAQFRPRAELSQDFLRAYWDALLANGKDAELEKQLTTALAESDRDIAAVAQNKRGDLQKEKRDYRAALVDGYLRTVVLFEDIKSAQPEALFKAAECFDQLGQAVYAEKMRKKLLAEFPQSPYAEKSKTG